ncbi:TetR/AcrR family transcriptional regulator [Desulfovibrio sp. JC010]|uniref:TetR/AcrR family transcriptional regulator n=1 Tax=Desulfovibrio sp. JC010 TaxID=2593641 RepID=UPI0013D1F931|nr:TetR/AcrR family transcriptional regulator [Desulfovibrio sp. JC010]NDV27105.1 TetR/AcrR family transcriptional regulator [Desulfovibrio sp. JC010]
MARTVSKEGTQKRKEQILKAAGNCFSAKGFHQSSMADICREAGLSPGTVYHYFSSKDEMIVHFAKQELEQARQFVEAMQYVDSLTGLVDFTIHAILELDEQEEMQVYLEVLTESGRNKEVGKLLTKSDEIVLRALEKHLKRLGADKGETSFSSLALYVGIQIVALEIFKLEKPSAKERRDMSLLFRRGLLHVLGR